MSSRPEYDQDRIFISVVRISRKACDCPTHPRWHHITPRVAQKVRNSMTVAPRANYLA